MKIISASLDQETLDKINAFQQVGYKGRSEVIRAAVKALEEKEANRVKMHGIITALLLVKHKESHSQSILEIQHKYQSLVQTHLHTHLENHTCLELFMLKGSADKIKKLVESYETSKKVQLVKLIIS